MNTINHFGIEYKTRDFLFKFPDSKEPFEITVASEDLNEALDIERDDENDIEIDDKIFMYLTNEEMNMSIEQLKEIEFDDKGKILEEII